MTKVDKLPPYFVDYMEERLKRMEDHFESNINEIKELLKGNGSEGLVKRVERLDKWATDFQARMGIIVSILGGIFALAFTLVKDVVANILKIR
jgi:replicative DNA helicase